MEEAASTSPGARDNTSFRESLPASVKNNDLQPPCRLSQLLNDMAAVKTKLQRQLQEMAEKEAQLRQDLDKIQEFELRLRSRLESIHQGAHRDQPPWQPQATSPPPPPGSPIEQVPTTAPFRQPTSPTPSILTTMMNSTDPPPAPEAGLHAVPATPYPEMTHVWNMSSKPAPFLKQQPFQGGGDSCACHRDRLLCRPQSTRRHRGLKKKARFRQLILSRSQSAHDPTQLFSLADRKVGPSPAPSLPPLPPAHQLLRRPTEQELSLVIQLLSLGTRGRFRF